MTKPFKYKIYTKEELVPISASKINLFYTCPASYAFQYLSDIEIKPWNWPGTGFGQALHDVVEWCMNQRNNGVNEKKVIKESNNKFTEFYDTWLKEVTTEKSFKKSRGYNYDEFIIKGEKFGSLISNFIVSYYPVFKHFYPELEFKIPYQYVEGVEVRGFIDLLIEYENAFDITDLKTTKDPNKFYFIDWEMDPQSLMYIYYIFATYNILPNSFAYLVVNHEDRVIFFKQKELPKIKTVIPEHFFRELTRMITEIRDFCYEPDFTLTCPEADRCKWCVYKEYCLNPYKSKLYSIAQKVLKK